LDTRFLVVIGECGWGSENVRVTEFETELTRCVASDFACFLSTGHFWFSLGKRDGLMVRDGAAVK
jgi:hypothetical protein